MWEFTLHGGRESCWESWVGGNSGRRGVCRGEAESSSEKGGEKRWERGFAQRDPQGLLDITAWEEGGKEGHHRQFERSKVV
jgi:hypothetical protein